MAGSLGVWWDAARPKTLAASVAPVLIGTAMAFSDGLAHWLSAGVALIGAMLIQIGTNYANDYYDHVKGTDRAQRTGPTRATAAGLVAPSAMKRAAMLAFALAILTGVYLVYRGGWPIVIVGLSGILFGILYTGGPYPLGYNGLGDIFVLIFFGPVAVGGTYFVQALDVTSVVIVAGLAPGLLSVAILTVNNLRDLETDFRAGKRTLAVRFGERFAKTEYIIAITLASLTPVALFIITSQHVYAIAATIIVVLSVQTMRVVVANADGKSMNQALAETGRLLMVYSILFSLGWLR